MQLPPHLNETDFLACVERVVAVLALRFRIPGVDTDDLKQHGWLVVWEAIVTGKYDPSRPLDAFLYAHIKNRYRNYRRDHHKRCDSPCRACYEGRPCGPDGRCCERHLTWQAKQDAKARVNRPVPLASIPEADEPRTTVEADVEGRELLALIDEHLDVDLRADYLRMLAGKAVAKHRRLAVEAAVRAIVGETAA